MLVGLGRIAGSWHSWMTSCTCRCCCCRLTLLQHCPAASSPYSKQTLKPLTTDHGFNTPFILPEGLFLTMTVWVFYFEGASQSLGSHWAKQMVLDGWLQRAMHNSGCLFGDREGERKREDS